MTDIDVLIRAHDENERLRLSLSPEAIAGIIDRHAERQAGGRPKRGRTRYADPTGDTAAARADGERR